MLKVSVYGVGNFGYAVLKHLDNKRSLDFSVKAYDRSPQLTKNLSKHRQHLFFHKDVRLSDHIQFVESPENLVEDCDILVLAVSSDGTREVLKSAKDYLKDGVVILNTAKALDYESGRGISSVVEKELAGHKFSYAVLSGGTIARDLFKHEPLGVDIACKDSNAARTLKRIFQSDNLYVHTSRDVVGVEYAGSYKNIVAILAGIVKGLGFSYGSETQIISRTAGSIGTACVESFGVEPATFSIGSQCWGNDLWMSCTGNTRNREFGVLLGKGMPAEKALATMKTAHKTIEGVNTLATIDQVPAIKSIEIIDLLYQLVISKTIDVKAIKSYLTNSKVSI